MAEFFKATEKKISMANADMVPLIANVPGNGPGNAKAPKADSKVGAMGDNAASNGSNAKLPGDLHKVGAMGDNAAKSGK